MVHPPLLQVGTLDEPVGFGVISDHSPGVSCDREDINMRRPAGCGDIILYWDSLRNSCCFLDESVVSS